MSNLVNFTRLQQMSFEERSAFGLTPDVFAKMKKSRLDFWKNHFLSKFNLARKHTGKPGEEEWMKLGELHYKGKVSVEHLDLHCEFHKDADLNLTSDYLHKLLDIYSEYYRRANNLPNPHAEELDD